MLRRKIDSNIPIWWMPQEGMQTEAAVCPVMEIGLMGNRGGGKSDTAIGRQVRGAARWGPKWNGLMIRRKYKQLAGLRKRFDELIAEGMPATRIGGDRETNTIRFNNSATITLASVLELKMAADWQGQGMTEISIEEATEFTFIAELVDRLHGALRSGGGVPTHMFLTGNPGGPGAGAIKAMFMTNTDGSPRKLNKVFYLGEGKEKTSRIFLESDIRDNRILMENDPNYILWLQSIKDPVLRAAWYEGSWERIIGQAFTLSPQNIIKPIWPIPPHAPLYMTLDWGWGAPFSVQWWWVDGEGRVYLAAEWYGMESINQPNRGLRLTDPQIAHGILEREQKLGILGRLITRLAGHDCANKKPSYQEGIQGPSTLEEFIKVAQDPQTLNTYGQDIHLNLVTMKPDNVLKIRQFRQRLAVPDDGTWPMLVVYETCGQFRRVIPSLCVDELTGEGLEAHQEDHSYDSAALMCMARPVGLEDHQLEKIRADERRKLRPRLDNVSQIAEEDFKRAVAELDELERDNPEYHAGVALG